MWANWWSTHAVKAAMITDFFWEGSVYRVRKRHSGVVHFVVGIKPNDVEYDLRGAGCQPTGAACCLQRGCGNIAQPARARVF